MEPVLRIQSGGLGPARGVSGVLHAANRVSLAMNKLQIIYQHLRSTDQEEDFPARWCFSAKSASSNRVDIPTLSKIFVR